MAAYNYWSAISKKKVDLVLEKNKLEKELAEGYKSPLRSLLEAAEALREGKLYERDEDGNIKYDDAGNPVYTTDSDTLDKYAWYLADDSQPDGYKRDENAAKVKYTFLGTKDEDGNYL